MGAAKIADLLAWCEEAGVEVVTLFLLSTDNLTPARRTSCDPLLEIIADVVDELAAPGAAVAAAHRRARWTCCRATMAAPARRRGRARTVRTGAGMQLNIAVGYGGRQEIADAVRKLLLQPRRDRARRSRSSPRSLDVDHIAEHLYTSGQPDPDLVIRTSGEQRLSGFLLWQSRALGVLVLRGLLARVPARSTSCGRCATTPPGTAASAPDHHCA